MAAGTFSAYYCLGEKVMAIATLMQDPKAAHFANLLLSNQSLEKCEALNGEWWQALLVDTNVRPTSSPLNLTEFDDVKTNTKVARAPSQSSLSTSPKGKR